MGIKHRVIINMTGGTQEKGRVLEAGHVTLPKRLLKLLFGDFTNIYLLAPGQSIESVEIHELSREEEAENDYQKNAGGR